MAQILPLTKPTILLTGATGFLGSHLLRRFVERGHPVVVLKRSTSKLARVEAHLATVPFVDGDRTPPEEIFTRHRIEAIVHCATHYGRRPTPPSEMIEANLILPLKLLELGAKAGVKTFVNSDTVLDKRVNDYSLSKRQFREWLEQFADRMVCANVALEHFYGPHDDATKFVSFIMQRLRMPGPQVIDLTPGEQKRDFVYIDDVVDAFERILETASSQSNGYRAYEVGTGRTVSLKHFMKLAQETAGNREATLGFGNLPYRPNEVMESRVNLAALEAIGWKPRVTLEEGLRRMVEAETKGPLP